MIKKKIMVGQITFGEQFLFCIPLAEKNTEKLIAMAEKVKKLKPDLVEWRADAMESYPKVDEIMDAGRKLKNILGEIPIIFTTRYYNEGGFKKIGFDEKYNLINVMYQSDLVDIVDIELRYADQFGELIGIIKESGKKILISYHNLKSELSESEVIDVLKKEQEKGADIVKGVFHADSFHDLVILGDSVDKANKEFLVQPIVLGTDGKMSVITRVLAEAIGSTMTYVAGAGASSHPSQVDINDLKRMKNRMKR